MECSIIIKIVTTLVTLGGFIITISTLIKNNRTKQIDNIIQLKKYLTDFDDINGNLLPLGAWNSNFNIENLPSQEKSRLFSYLGFFEICNVMLKEKQLTKKEFEIFFRYRLRNIADNVALKEYIYSDINHWGNLIDLMNEYVY